MKHYESLVNEFAKQSTDQPTACARILAEIYETMEQRWSEVQERFIRLEKEKEAIQDEWKLLYNAKDEIIEEWKSSYKMKEEEAQSWKERFYKCQEESDRNRQRFDQAIESIRNCITLRFRGLNSESSAAAATAAMPSSSIPTPTPQSQSFGESQSSVPVTLQAGKIKPKIELVRIHHPPTKEPRTPTAPNSRRPPGRATPITPITPSNGNRKTIRTVYEVEDSPEPQPMEILTVKNPSKRIMGYDIDDYSEDDTGPQRTNKQKRRKVSKAGPSHPRKNRSLQNEDVTRAICDDTTRGASEEYDEIAIRPGDNGMISPSPDRRKT